MKMIACLIVLLPLFFFTKAQTRKGRIEAYATPSLFSTQLSNDSLVPPKRRGTTRLGDVSCFGLQYGVPITSHLLVKAGIGYTIRHFSMNKYGLDDFFTALFAFDSSPRKDSFAISNVRYTNRYVEVPLSVSFGSNNLSKRLHLNYGMNVRLQFLIKSNVTIIPDATASFILPAEMAQIQHAYTKDMNSFVLAVEPFMDVNMRIYKGAGVYFRCKPFALYASPLSSRVTKGEAEFLGTGFGIWYQF